MMKSYAKEFEKKPFKQKMSKALLLMSVAIISSNVAYSAEDKAGDDPMGFNSALLRSSSDQAGSDLRSSTGGGEAPFLGALSQSLRDSSEVVSKEQMVEEEDPAGKFLRDVNKALAEMESLEKLVAPYLATHLNPLNPSYKSPLAVAKIPVRPGWQALMVNPVVVDKGTANVSKFKVIGDKALEEALQARLAKIPADKLLETKRKEAREKREKFKKEVAEKLNEKQVKQEKLTDERKTYSHNVMEVSLGSGLQARPVSEDDLKRLSEMVSTWYLGVCEGAPGDVRGILNGIDKLSQLLRSLPLQLAEPMVVKGLFELIENNEKTELILGLLNGLVVDYFLLRAQGLWERLLPGYLDLTTSVSTLKNIKEEGEREDDFIKALLEDTNLFKSVFSTIVKVIQDKTSQYMEKALVNIKEQDTRTIVTKAFELAIAHFCDGGMDPFRKPKESKFQADIQVTIDSKKIVLREVISTIVNEALQIAAHQSTGRSTERIVYDEKTSTWRRIVVPAGTLVGKEVSYPLKGDTFAVNVTPLMQALHSIVSSLAPKGGLLTRGPSIEAPPAIEVIYVPVPDDIQAHWKISSSPLGEKKAAEKKAEEQKVEELKNAFPKVQPKGIASGATSKEWDAFTEETRRDYVQSQSPLAELDYRLIEEREDFLNEIVQSRSFQYVLENGRGKSGKRREKPAIESLSDFLSQSIHKQNHERRGRYDFAQLLPPRGRVLIMQDMPKVFSFRPEVRVAELLQDLGSFFRTHLHSISDMKRKVQGNLDAYFNPKRVGVEFQNTHKRKLTDAFSVALGADTEKAWNNIMPMRGKGGSLTHSEERVFRKELSTHVQSLSTLEKNLADYLEKYGDGVLNADKKLALATMDLSVERFIKAAEELMVFKTKSTNFAAGKSFAATPEEIEAAKVSFKGKFEADITVKEALNYVKASEEANSQGDRERRYHDWKTVISFFKSFFSDTLTESLKILNGAEQSLDKLKQMFAYSGGELEDEDENESAPIGDRVDPQVDSAAAPLPSASAPQDGKGLGDSQQLVSLSASVDVKDALVKASDDAGGADVVATPGEEVVKK